MKIGVITTTRAEYGVMKYLLDALVNDADTDVMLIVSGTHLLPEYGNTVDQIIEDGYDYIAVPVDICTEKPSDITKTMANYSLAFADFFSEKGKLLDFLIVVGDRYELLPICSAAYNERIPIAHVSGGEVSAGAIDDVIRHCITKFSFLHFPACESYCMRVIQLGESPDRVFNVGDIGVEVIKKLNPISEIELRADLGLPSDLSFFVVTYHPVTLSQMSPQQQMDELFEAIKHFPSLGFVITKTNADVGGEYINQRLEEFASLHDNVFLFDSLGIRRFVSLQRYSLGLLGNSSSGIIETPSLGVPTINIGDRQKGRLKADSVIDCAPIAEDIERAIKKAQSQDMIERARKCINPYGLGNTGEEIVKTIKNFLREDKVNLMKGFYDLEM